MIKPNASRRISVIVPTYFRASEMDGLLLPSLLVQSLPPNEIIVVDDTPDGSVMAVCEKWRPLFEGSNTALVYLRNPLEKSAARAKKYGGSQASSDLLTFLDSDLILERDYLKWVLRVFQDDPGAVGVQGHIVNAAETPKLHGFYRLIRKPEGTAYAILSCFLRNFIAMTVPSTDSCRLFEYPRTLHRTITCDWLIGANTTVRSDIYGSIEPDPGLRGYSFGEDVLLSLKLKRLGMLYITPWAKCRHMESPSGRMDTTSLLWQERYFLGRVFGARGSLVYYNRRVLFGMLRAAGLM